MKRYWFSRSSNRCSYRRNQPFERTCTYAQKRPPFIPWPNEKVGHRRNLLAYLRQKDVQRYRELIQALGLRR